AAFKVLDSFTVGINHYLSACHGGAVNRRECRPGAEHAEENEKHDESEHYLSARDFHALHEIAVLRFVDIMRSAVGQFSGFAQGGQELFDRLPAGGLIGR